MGTRNLSLLKKDGKLVICQYGQWDGYPEGQGVRVLNFCQDEEAMKKLKEIIPTIRNVDEIPEYIKEHDKVCPKWSTDPDNRTPEMKYVDDKLFSRDVCAGIFDNIINIDYDRLPKEFNKAIYLTHYNLKGCINYCDMWIEYAYLINLDTNKLECYGYEKLLKEYDLDNLPTEEQFIADLEVDEEE